MTKKGGRNKARSNSNTAPAPSRLLADVGGEEEEDPKPAESAAQNKEDGHLEIPCEGVDAASPSKLSVATTAIAHGEDAAVSLPLLRPVTEARDALMDTPHPQQNGASPREKRDGVSSSLIDMKQGVQAAKEKTAASPPANRPSLLKIAVGVVVLSTAVILPAVFLMMKAGAADENAALEVQEEGESKIIVENVVEEAGAALAACRDARRLLVLELEQHLGDSERWIERRSRPEAVLRRLATAAVFLLASACLLAVGYILGALRSSWKASFQPPAKEARLGRGQQVAAALSIPEEMDPRKPLADILAAAEKSRRSILSASRMMDSADDAGTAAPVSLSPPVLFLSQQRYAVAINDLPNCHLKGELPSSDNNNSMKSFTSEMSNDTVQCTSFSEGESVSRKTSELIDVLTLMRHGERLDHVEKTWSGSADLPASDPPLSQLGRLQAIEAALFLRSQMGRKKVRQRLRACCSYIITSPFHRCVETAIILSVVGFDGAVPVFVDPLLADFMQGKVFSTPPKIGGRFQLSSRRGGGGGGGEGPLEFVPASLTLVTSAIAQAVQNAQLMNTFGIDDKTKASWVRLSSMFPSTASKAAGGESAAGAVRPFATLEIWTSDGLYTDLTTSCRASGVSSLGFVTGRQYPETPGKFAERISESIGLRFSMNRLAAPLIHRSHAASVAATGQEAAFSSIPRVVLDAEATDVQRTRGILWRTPRKYRFSAFPPANGLYVTHADVITHALEMLVPRVKNPYSGMAVPYASLTSIVKRNTYYTVSEVSLATSTASEDEGFPLRSEVASLRRNIVPPSWVAEEIGSTSHLQSKVLIRYSH